MSRLEDGMNMVKVMELMAGHNRGAYIAMRHITAYEQARPMIALLDQYEIYGTDLYVLYNDKCHGLVGKLYTLLMATRLGLLSEEGLHKLAKDQNDMVHFTEETCKEFELTMRKAHELTQKTKERTTNSTQIKKLGY